MRPSWVGLLFGAAAAIVASILLVLAIRVLLVPFVASLFLAYLYQPALEMLQRRGMDRGRAFLLILTASLIVLSLLAVVAPSWLRLESLGGSTQTFAQRLDFQLDALERRIERRVPMFRAIQVHEQVSGRVSAFAEDFVLHLPALISSFILNLILVPFIAFFMVRDGRRLRRRIAALVPNRYFEMALMMFYRIDDQIGGYLRGRLIECMLVGLVQLIMMGIAGMIVPQPQILVISVVCGVTNLIPYAGPVIGGAFGVFLYMSDGSLPIQSIWALIIVIVLAHLIDNIIIAPAVLSHNVNLHPLTVALVLIIGGETLGVLGLLIAIPVASSVKVIAQEFYANYQAQLR